MEGVDLEDPAGAAAGKRTWLGALNIINPLWILVYMK